jgi:hypothetical protein
MTIRVEDLGRAVARQRLLHCFNAKIRFQRDRHAPCQDAAPEPVQHSGEVDGPARHRNAGEEPVNRYLIDRVNL